MEIIDYNGTAEWSSIRIQERYAAYCAELRVPVLPMTTREHREGDRLWIYPLLDELIQRMEKGDPASIAIGIDLIEEDQSMPFGRIYKSNTARALRRNSLSAHQQARLRKRIVSMLVSGVIQREFREYAKLLRTIKVREYWPELHASVPRHNQYAMRYYHLLAQSDTEADNP